MLNTFSNKKLFKNIFNKTNKNTSKLINYSIFKLSTNNDYYTNSDKNYDENNNKKNSDFYPEDDLIFDIKKPEKFKGMLVICPTPIGNINDITIRQYEAIKAADIIACEDSRVTAKLIDNINKKKMKDMFYMEFGINFDEFVDSGGLDMDDDRIIQKFFKRDTEKSNIYSNNLNDMNIHEDQLDNYNTFYINKEDEMKKEILNNKLNKLDKQIKDQYKNKFKQTKDLSLSSTEVIDTNYLENKLFNNFKPKENVYNYIKDEDDFKNKRDLMENEDISEEIETIANDYAKNKSLSYKLKAKAKYIMGVNRNLYRDYEKIKKQEANIDSSNNKFGLEDNCSYKDNYNNPFKDKINYYSESDYKDDYIDFSSLDDNSSNSNSFFFAFKEKLKQIKLKKGRGLLFSYRKETEEYAVPKLIRAMKLGVKVTLVCDAGTPTISDPGFKLVNTCWKEGISVESLPGPCALITALSASGMPTSNFMFIGYISRISKEKLEILNKIKSLEITCVLYEASNRVDKTLEAIESVFGPDHIVYIGNEISKKFESHYNGKVCNIKSEISNLGDYQFTNKLDDNYTNKDNNHIRHFKGESTIVISPFKIKGNDDILKNKLLSRDINTTNEVNILEASRKLNKKINMGIKDLINLIIEVLGVNKHKAERIAKFVKEEEKLLKKQ